MKFLFYKPLKLNQKDDEICFWSDTHFGHLCSSWANPLWKMRGFDSVEEHDQILISNWNKTATPNSIFFHLGDFIFGFNTVDRFKTIIEHLNFNTLYIMPGNHNSGWKQNFEQQTGTIWNIHQDKKVVFVPNYLEIIANNQPIVLSHYPILSFNGQAKGSWMLHGHCHASLYKNDIGKMLYKAKIKDLTFENSPYPQTFRTLKTFFNNRPNITYDHHDEQIPNPF